MDATRNFTSGGVFFIITGTLLIFYGLILIMKRPKTEKFLEIDRDIIRTFLVGVSSVIGGLVLCFY